MKTSNRNATVAGAGLLMAALLSLNATAAQNAEKTFTGCPHSQLVTNTETKPLLANGRGPLVTVSSGTSRACLTENDGCPNMASIATDSLRPASPNGRGPLVRVAAAERKVCAMCPVKTTEVTNAWRNGRGPLVTTEVTRTGVAHNCSSGCAEPKG